jgi:hypothetical protein
MGNVKLLKMLPKLNLVKKGGYIINRYGNPLIIYGHLDKNLQFHSG